MTTTIVHQGRTKHLTGASSTGDTLTANGGNASNTGAHLVVKDNYVNGGIIVLENGTRQNGPGATLTDSGVLVNTGVITAGDYHLGRSALVTITASGLLVNSGSLDVQGGENDFGNGGGLLINRGQLTNSNLINLSGGRYTYAAYQLAGATLKDVGILSNSGSIAVGGGIGNVRGTEGAGALLDVAGSLANSGVITVTGASPSGSAENQASNGTLSVAGTLTNTGTIFLSHSPSQHFANGGGNGVFQLSGTLDNAGALYLRGGNNGEKVGGSGATLDNTGVLTNTGAIRLQGGQAPGSVNLPGSGAALIDSGTLTNQGKGSISTYNYFYNGPYHSYAYNGPGAMIDVTASGTLVNRASLYVSGGGHGTGGVLIDAGVLNNSGVVTVGGADPSRYREPSPVGTGGTILVEGALTNAGTLTLVSEKFIFEGPSATLVDSGVLTNAGLIQATAAPAGAALAQLLVTSTGTLANAGTLTGSGTLINQGLITDGGSTKGDIAFTYFDNDSTVTIAAGEALRIDSAITADPGALGTLNIAATGSLTLNGAVAASQSVSLGGQGALLTLGDAKDFHATIDNFTTGETIDLVKLIATSATASGTTLDIGLSTGTTLAFTLGAPLDTGLTPTATSDGHGGTDITLIAATASIAHQDFTPFTTTPAGHAAQTPRAAYALTHRDPDFSHLQLHWIRPA